MKPILLLPPVVALVIAGTWLASQHQAISTLEQETAALQKAIAAQLSGGGGESSRSKQESAAKLAKEKQPLDWKKIAAQLTESMQSGGMGDMRENMRLQQRLQAMSKEELVTALDEIAALDLSKESRAMLEQMLIGPLAGKDPELVLTKFVDRIQDTNGMMSWQLVQAMQELAKKDPAKAAAWFDQQIAAGKFDSKSLDGNSRSRVQFEGSLLNVLIGSDPDAAGHRLAALPSDQRKEVLTQYSGHDLKEADQPAFAKLVRDQVPENDQANALGHLASRVVSKDGYPKVSEMLDRIQATPAERTACVEEAATSKIQTISYRKKVTREDLDAMREWVTAQSPQSTGKVTGEALGNASNGNKKMDFSEASALAMEYNSAAGNDDVLTNFLGTDAASENKEQARVLAQNISDEKSRTDILKRLE